MRFQSDMSTSTKSNPLFSQPTHAELRPVELRNVAPCVLSKCTRSLLNFTQKAAFHILWAWRKPKCKLAPFLQIQSGVKLCNQLLQSCCRKLRAACESLLHSDPTPGFIPKGGTCAPVVSALRDAQARFSMETIWRIAKPSSLPLGKSSRLLLPQFCIASRQ